MEEFAYEEEINDIVKIEDESCCNLCPIGIEIQYKLVEHIREFHCEWKMFYF